MKIEYRVMVARSHALWVIGTLAQAHFLEHVPLAQFTAWIARIRPSWRHAGDSEECLEKFKLDIAACEEVVVDAASKPDLKP